MSVTVQKARDPIASEKQIVFIDNSKTQWRWDELAVQVQTPKHSGGANIIGSAGAVTRQCSVSSSGREHSPVRTLQGNTEHDQARNSLRTWKTDTESKETTRVKTTIWQRITETPARYRQCRTSYTCDHSDSSSGARQRWQAQRAGPPT